MEKGKKRLRLESFRESARILDPRSGFSEAVSQVEVRIDPLTGARSRINVTRASRPKQGLQPREFAAKECPFCPESREKDTPKFTKDFSPEGRLVSGGALLFPNLFPLAGLHGVCIFTSEHKLDIGSITREEIGDGLACCIKFFRICERFGSRHHFLGWNHLPPAGASILHPHFQALAADAPLKGVRDNIEFSRNYESREGGNYWEDLVAAERGSPRYIGETNGFAWMAPWAPLGNYEVIGISNEASLLELSRDEIAGLSDGLAMLLKGLAELGVNSVNMGIASAPRGASFFRTHVRLMARPVGGISDRALLEIYGGETGITTIPEEYAAYLRFH
jgi:galactose-1-phosphate uridylyltransferase